MSKNSKPQKNEAPSPALIRWLFLINLFSEPQGDESAKALPKKKQPLLNQDKKQISSSSHSVFSSNRAQQNKTKNAHSGFRNYK